MSALDVKKVPENASLALEETVPDCRTGGAKALAELFHLKRARRRT